MARLTLATDRARRFVRRALAVATAAALVGFGVGLPAAAQDRASFQPRCLVATLDNAPHAICETGPIAGGRITGVRYQKEGTTGTAEANFLFFTSVGKASAVLAVVDRGDRRRQRVVGLEAGDATRLIEAARVAGPANRFGLGQIGDRFDAVAQIGASRDEIARASAAIRADGNIGDSGRAAIDAIRQLTLAQAERFVLVVASDGKAEDRAYGRDDVIKAARDAKVVVVTLAYRDQPQAAGAEAASLRRLAEETGGLYFDVAGAAGRLDDAAVNRFAQFVGSGGTATFPLNRTDPRGRYLITLEFDTGRTVSGSFFADVQAAQAQPQQANRPPATGPQTSGGNAPPTGQQPGGAAGTGGAGGPAGRNDVPAGGPGLMERTGLDNLADWIAGEWRNRPQFVIAVPVIIILIGAVVVWFNFRRRRRLRVFAWLELADQHRTRVPVAAIGIRIGRHSDNDIRFENQSVHRYHAVLHRDVGTGQFVISDVSRDLERSNGVLVNGETVIKAPLANGDTVELGEVKFRFLYA